MMIKPLLLSLMALFLLSACEKEKDSFVVVDTVPVYPRGDIQRFFLDMDHSPDTVFLIEANAPATLRTSGGVLLELPPNAFAYTGGTIVDGAIRLHWKQIRTIYDQIARRISQDHEGDLLQSAFSFELLADKEGVPLELTVPITVKWPDNQPKGFLELWQGRFEDNLGFQWTVSAPGAISISSWVDPVLGSGTSGYFFTIDRTGIVNVAALQDLAQEQTAAMSCVFFPAYNESNTAAWFIEPWQGRVIALRDLGQGRFGLPAIPGGSTGKLFCVTEAVRHRFFSASRDVAATGDTLRWEPRPAEQPLHALHQWIRAL